MKIEAGKTYEATRTIGAIEKGTTFKVEKYTDGGTKAIIKTSDGELSTEECYNILKLHLKEVSNQPSKPAHYDTAIDTLAFAKANFSREQVEGFMRINAIKYLQRVKKGQVLEDLKKSRSYIDMLIEMEEEKDEN